MACLAPRLPVFMGRIEGTDIEKPRRQEIAQAVGNN
jgi:hypothetical protein